ncbi:hypothetical protein [Pectobacterium versatile]|jgi:hypothetical protein|uniref:hypothetical protein n=1 Tax=Pectobacterium versatile TaxID=2488639 RepID=UPI001B396868|nr:hypothetical protein [Pectobacterium versatile]MBQ4777684.1 hypothetical protein [Pectobacterium versatile]
MAISATIKAKQLNGVVPYSRGYVEIDVEGLDIADAVKADEIVPEYVVDDILDAVGTDDVIKWLEGQGFTLSEE